MGIGEDWLLTLWVHHSFWCRLKVFLESSKIIKCTNRPWLYGRGPRPRIMLHPRHVYFVGCNYFSPLHMESLCCVRHHCSYLFTPIHYSFVLSAIIFNFFSRISWAVLYSLHLLFMKRLCCFVLCTWLGEIIFDLSWITFAFRLSFVFCLIMKKVVFVW